MFGFVELLILANKLSIVDFVVHFGEASFGHGEEEIDEIFRRAIIAIASFDHFFVDEVPLIIVLFNKLK